MEIEFKKYVLSVFGVPHTLTLADHQFTRCPL